MSGFFALLDDIATLAKLTLSTVDDTASMAVKTSAKVSAAAVDDVATTPQYVTGITPDRELPIIKRITLGSLRNKLLIILPIGLLLTAGDFVRWCKQLLDVVGQIASLSPPPDASPEQARAVTSLSMRAAEASLDLNRGVVSWSAV